MIENNWEGRGSLSSAWHLCGVNSVIPENVLNHESKQGSWCKMSSRGEQHCQPGSLSVPLSITACSYTKGPPGQQGEEKKIKKKAVPIRKKKKR